MLLHPSIHTDMSRNKHHIAAITPSICSALQSSVSYPKGFYQWGLRAQWLKLQCAAIFRLYNQNPSITFPPLPSWAVCKSARAPHTCCQCPYQDESLSALIITKVMNEWWGCVLDRLHSVCLLWDGRTPPSRFRTGWRSGQIPEKCWLAPAAPG